MPRSDETSVTVKAELAQSWQQTAERLGYGEHGRHKFLSVALEIADAHPSLFRKR